MLSTSKIYTFIDEENNYLLHFLDGQKLIHDLVLTHNLSGESFNPYRHIILESQMLTCYLSVSETLGLYIENEKPRFQLKIEMNSHGYMRTLFLPNDLKFFPDKLSGKTRISKLITGKSSPYTSIVENNNLHYSSIIQKVFDHSYQMQVATNVSGISDQCIMVSQLPLSKSTKKNNITPEQYLGGKDNFLEHIYAKSLNESEEIVNEFKKEKYSFLKSAEVQFKCSCSRDRMFTGVFALSKTNSINDIFGTDTSIETKCDYCNKTYTFIRNDFENIAVN